MKYVNCPKCGHKLLEGESGSNVNVKCNKCKTVVNVRLQDDVVSMFVVSGDTTKQFMSK